MNFSATSLAQERVNAAPAKRLLAGQWKEQDHVRRDDRDGHFYSKNMSLWLDLTI